MNIPRRPLRGSGGIYRIIVRSLGAAGYRLIRTQRGGWPLDFRGADIAIVQAVQPYTMTSPERIKAIADATRHIIQANVAGAIVECGVWRGGSMMAAALTLLEAGCADRELVLCDVFDAAMPSPKACDRTVTGDSAQSGEHYWNYVTRDEVARNMASTHYPDGLIRYVQGRVEETLPAAAPDRIALLRLDTDWYESTRHELETLYPRLELGGVLIIDDYGSHEGARMAVDEFFSAHEAAAKPSGTSPRRATRPLLTRVDETGVIGVKAASGVASED
jgi:O-methyltransferase